MSLDVHIGTDATSASKELPRFSLTELEHVLIFTKCNINNNELLCRIKDYYSDSIYTINEIPSLLSELQGNIPKCNDNNTIKVLVTLIEICKEAQNDNKNLYFFAD